MWKWCGKFFVANILALVFYSAISNVYYNGGLSVNAPVAGEVLDRAAGNSILSRFNEGGCFTKFDIYGFNNAYYSDFNRDLSDVDVLVLGSSHVDAYQVPDNLNFVYLLNERFASNENVQSFYNGGRSGHTFTIRSGRYEEAIKFWGAKKYVVLEIYRMPTLEEVNDALEGNLKNGGASEFVRRVAKIGGGALQLGRVQFFHIIPSKTDHSASNKKNEGTLDELLLAKELELGLDKLVQKVCDVSEAYHVTPIVFFHSQFHLKKNGMIEPSWNAVDLAAFRAICERKGVAFVDATERFREEYEKNNVWPYGFSNAGIISGHLNRDGHRMIADVLEEKIRELEAENKESEAQQ